MLNVGERHPAVREFAEIVRHDHQNGHHPTQTVECYDPSLNTRRLVARGNSAHEIAPLSRFWLSIQLSNNQ